MWVPDGALEALRDLTWAREDMKPLQRHGKQRLLAFLLRHGMRCAGKSRRSISRINRRHAARFATNMLCTTKFLSKNLTGQIHLILAALAASGRPTKSRSAGMNLRNQHGESEEVVRLTSCYHNLLGLWAET